MKGGETSKQRATNELVVEGEREGGSRGFMEGRRRELDGGRGLERHERSSGRPVQAGDRSDFIALGNVVPAHSPRDSFGGRSLISFPFCCLFP